jgi:hypothetical protein
VAVPLIPSALDQIGRRAFSLFPPIVGTEHNQWLLRRLTSTDIEILNRKTAQELVIPRRFVGEVSAVEEPFLIVGLVKELEYKEGAVLPHRRRVIEMPRAVNGPASFGVRLPVPSRPAAVVGIRLETRVRHPWRRALACVALALMLIAAGILACVQAVGSHLRGSRHRAADRAPVQAIPTF